MSLTFSLMNTGPSSSSTSISNSQRQLPKHEHDVMRNQRETQTWVPCAVPGSITFVMLLDSLDDDGADVGFGGRLVVVDLGEGGARPVDDVVAVIFATKLFQIL